MLSDGALGDFSDWESTSDSQGDRLGICFKSDIWLVLSTINVYRRLPKPVQDWKNRNTQFVGKSGIFPHPLLLAELWQKHTGKLALPNIHKQVVPPLSPLPKATFPGETLFFCLCLGSCFVFI
jgi:hypothetical protein